ncbi:MAG TPA: hypothetical protein VHJ56_06980, partial [Candidatus Binatia bacterium]|nr:hypothetical protein [Candidatus Binatia bacterium]
AIMGGNVLGTGIKADQPSPYTSYADEPLAPLTSASLAFSVVNPKNETNSLVGVLVKVRSFFGLAWVVKHEFFAFGQETIFDQVGTGSAL